MKFFSAPVCLLLICPVMNTSLLGVSLLATPTFEVEDIANGVAKAINQSEEGHTM